MNIWIAAADNNIDKVKSYLESNEFTPNSKDHNGYTPIHAAAEYAHLDLLEFLIEKGGDPNVKDSEGDTPLHACEQVEVAKLLIELGADINITNSHGYTPLQKAEEDADFPELVAFLRHASGIPNSESELPSNISLSVASADASTNELPEVSEEQRMKIAEIIENGTDKDFEDYLRGLVESKASEIGQNDDSKRQRGEPATESDQN